MAKVEAPYKNTFSLNNDILSHACSVAFKVGQLAYAGEGRPTDEDAATAARFILLDEGIELNPSQMRGLRRGEDVPLVPVARNIFKLYKKLPRLSPYEQSLLTEFESAAFPEGVPNRMSRTIDGCDFPLPPHSKVQSLVKGLFSFAKKNKGKMHPLVLACMLYYEVITIAPYSIWNHALAKIWFKLMLGEFSKGLLLLPIEKMMHSRKESLQQAFDESIQVKDGQPFIGALMQIIDDGVDTLIRRSLKKPDLPNPRAEKLVAAMEDGVFYGAGELLELLGLKSRLGLQKNYLKPALERKMIEMSNPLCPTDRTQRYRKKQ